MVCWAVLDFIIVSSPPLQDRQSRDPSLDKTWNHIGGFKTLRVVGRRERLCTLWEHRFLCKLDNFWQLYLCVFTFFSLKEGKVLLFPWQALLQVLSLCVLFLLLMLPPLHVEIGLISLSSPLVLLSLHTSIFMMDVCTLLGSCHAQSTTQHSECCKLAPNS